MIEVEENSEKQCEWDSKEDIANIDIPESHQPGTIQSRKEGLTGRKCSHINISHVTNVNEASEEDDGQRGAIVLEELPNESFEEVAVAQFSADPCTHQDKQRNHNGQVCRCFSHRPPLSSEYLNTFLEVDTSNVKTKDIARESGDVG